MVKVRSFRTVRKAERLEKRKAAENEERQSAKTSRLYVKLNKCNKVQERSAVRT